MGILATVVTVAFLGGGGLYFVVSGGVYFSEYLKTVRSDPDTASRLADQSTTVELAGTARPHEQTDQAPFTDAETLVYEAQILESDGKATNRKGTDGGNTPFLLDDDTGTVLVDPAGATLQIERTSKTRVNSEETPPKPIAEFLDASVWLDADTQFDRRYIESRIDPGDEVHIRGPVRKSGHSEDLPAGVDAVVGAKNAREGPVDVTELSVSGITDRFMSDVEDVFVITDGDQNTAARKLRYNGLIGFAIGIPLLAVTAGVVLIGGV